MYTQVCMKERPDKQLYDSLVITYFKHISV